MKISVFNDSPSGKNSATNIIVSSFFKGAESEGTEVNNIFLCEKHIELRRVSIFYPFTSYFYKKIYQTLRYEKKQGKNIVNFADES